MIARRLPSLVLTFALSLPAHGLAQTPGTAAAFQSLSPGEQKIDHALFQAQRATADGAAPLSLDQIAALKAERQSWTKVFEQMRMQGLLRAKSLGEVIAHYEQHASLGGERVASAPTVVIATGTGRIHTLAVSANPPSRPE